MREQELEAALLNREWLLIRYVRDILSHEGISYLSHREREAIYDWAKVPKSDTTDEAIWAIIDKHVPRRKGMTANELQTKILEMQQRLIEAQARLQQLDAANLTPGQEAVLVGSLADFQAIVEDLIDWSETFLQKLG